MNYQKLVLIGNATGDAERKTSRKGDVAYTRFQMGVSSGKDQSTYFKVAVFGERGEALAEKITRGRQVFVEGQIKVSKNGKFGVVANQIRLGPPNKESR